MAEQTLKQKLAEAAGIAWEQWKARHPAQGRSIERQYGDPVQILIRHDFDLDCKVRLAVCNR